MWGYSCCTDPKICASSPKSKGTQVNRRFFEKVKNILMWSRDHAIFSWNWIKSSWSRFMSSDWHYDILLHVVYCLYAPVLCMNVGKISLNQAPLHGPLGHMTVWWDWNPWLFRVNCCSLASLNAQEKVELEFEKIDTLQISHNFAKKKTL